MLRRLSSNLVMNKPKVIVIAGTTGVGKSDLSVQLASKFNGEIINSDSMQMYTGIPIITNKHPIEERLGITHHLMNHVPWNEEYYIHRFDKECTKAIAEIVKKGKTPIIVGGTHYYLQTLFNKRVDEKVRHMNEKEIKILESDDPQLIHHTLSQVDPDISKRFHINDTRRVKRMLEIYYTTGKKPSVTFENQDNSLKYDTLFFWIYSNPEELERRLNERVDKMMQLGAMEEIQELYKYYKSHNFSPENCENGVWQVIGFKEFLPWLENNKSCGVDECISKMKIRTRQYARRQIKWIKKMLIPDVNGDVYLLDATDLSRWNESVSSRADVVASEFLSGTTISLLHAPADLGSLLTYCSPNSPKNENDWVQFVCPICKDKQGNNLIIIGTKNWEIHLRSRRHRSKMNQLHKKKSYEVWKNRKEEEIEACIS